METKSVISKQSTNVEATSTEAKSFKTKRATISLGARVVRMGDKISLTKLLTTVNAPTINNLDNLKKKFGIEWKPTAFDNTLPPNVKSGPAHAFIVEGRTENGKKVFYDRFQFILFVDGKREKIQNALRMSKNKFAKLAV